MAVPKKRTGKSAQAKRRANWKATKPEVVICPNCGEFALAHTVCTACGYYKGKPVSLKDAPAVEEVVEEKKPAKKSTKKAAKAEETKATEEVKAEETKTEEPAAKKTEEVAEEKKPAKKSTKKAAKTEETKEAKETKETKAE